MVKEGSKLQVDVGSTKKEMRQWDRDSGDWEIPLQEVTLELTFECQEVISHADTGSKKQVEEKQCGQSRQVVGRGRGQRPAQSFLPRMRSMYSHYGVWCGIQCGVE